MRWSAFVLGAAATVVGPRVLKAVVRGVTKGAVAVRKEVAKAVVEAEKDIETKRAATAGPTGQA